MRMAVIQDGDGSCEYHKVKLEPSNWCVFLYLYLAIAELMFKKGEYML